jgi:hypothetical protein
MKTHEPGFERDTKDLAGRREHLVNSTFATVNDHDPVAREQTFHDMLSQFRTIPVTIAYY